MPESKQWAAAVAGSHRLQRQLLLLNATQTSRFGLDQTLTINLRSHFCTFPAPYEPTCRSCRCDGSNALILPAKGAGAGAASAAAGAAAAQQTLSKSQLKKLKQVQMKKQRREELTQVCLC
jgi:hypothetical protein